MTAGFLESFPASDWENDVRVRLGDPPSHTWSDGARTVRPAFELGETVPSRGWHVVEFPDGVRLIVHESRLWFDGAPEPC